MIDLVPGSWQSVLEPVLARPEAQRLDAWLQGEEAGGRVIHPPRDQWLRAFELTPLEDVKVVILGQDPYHGPGQAHGLAFSVPEGVRHPPSLRNIFKERQADLDLPVPESGNLEHWARQGVLLLNNALTVADGAAGSHQQRGWEAITDAAVSAVAQRERPSVFILWGSHAQKKAPDVNGLSSGTRHCVIASPHPSPLSAHRGFFGSRPFSRANAFLRGHGQTPISW